ncbi:MAG TPA: DUF192 domain-containing protein [Candidatus Desulfaltia sp.]|nr:DUF192 domain-containing protein [Candidatus Desulfaltia sp.]
MKKKFILLLAFLTLYCSGQTGRDRFIKVYFPDGFAVIAELAVNDEERARGLMFREQIHEDQAMLFLFAEEDIHSFWMKNMRFPIDILWLDRGKRIVHIEARVPPCPREPCPTYVPAAAAAFVLELQSGCAEKHGLRVPDRLEFILPKELSGPRSQLP